VESESKVCRGGTLAEELIYRETSNGASSDLERASRVARRMVKEFGMSRLGRVYFHEATGAAFLAGPAAAPGEREHSEQTAREIDIEVRKILDDATEEVRAILQARAAALRAVAQRLVEKEVIDGTELQQLLEQNSPGPRLVPGSLAVPPAGEAAPLEHWPETGKAANAATN